MYAMAIGYQTRPGLANKTRRATTVRKVWKKIQGLEKIRKQ